MKVATRSPGAVAKGSPRQALSYLVDNHDRDRDVGCSEAELSYIARLDPGWKTDLEGGSVPLIGHGALASVEKDQLFARFEDACQPWHDRRGSTGYKSLTFTLPKELSLYAEGHREQAKAAMHAAIQTALRRAFPNVKYFAAAAIHTRNTAGEIHYHAHVLVAKFAQTEKGRTVSLNSKAGGNGPVRLNDLKRGWREGIEREFRERLQLSIEQKRANGPVSLVLADGRRLDPLNRNSRRLLEKEIAPRYTETSPSGATLTKQFRWCEMDDRIFEVASGKAGRWDSAAFADSFPNLSKRAASYEARVRTLQAAGYLSPGGAISPQFRIHFCVRHGVLTPELQRVRLDLQKHLKREGKPAPRTAQDLWDEIQSRESLRRRVIRLGVTREQLDKIHEQAQARKPTNDRLAVIRSVAEKRARQIPSKELPKTKTIIRAFVDVQKARVQRVYLLTTGALLFWRFQDNRALAQKITNAAQRDLFYAKERRLAQIGRALRPVFWLVRVTMPKEANRLEWAIHRCARLAQQQESRKAGRDAVRQAYLEWRRDFVEKPRAELERQALRQHETPQRTKEPARPEELEKALGTFRRGLPVLQALRPQEFAHLRSWSGSEAKLVDQVVRRARGENTDLTKEQYEAAVKAGRIGHLLDREAAATPLKIPNAFNSQREQLQRVEARFAAFGMKSPFAGRDLNALSPADLKQQLGIAKRAGLLDDGPDWTLKATAARGALDEIARHADRARNVDDQLQGNLTRKR